MKTREGSTPIILNDMFICVSHHERLMTVIDPFGQGYGYPFYRSTGKNSGHKDTWFPHRGIKASGWIMKPSYLSLPDDIKNFYDNLKIDKELIKIRFGNLQTLCISASIGNGFWSTEKGNTFKEFLWENYSGYFLNASFVQAFLDAEKKGGFEKISFHKVNAKLDQLNSMILLDCSWSRLPTISEVVFFELQHTELVRKALTSMLVKESAITEAPYQAILALADTPHLKELVGNHFFEDDEQVQALIQLLKQKNPISMEELNAIDALRCSGLDEEEDFQDLLENIKTRDLLRYLNRKKELDKDSLAMINTLMDLEYKRAFLFNEDIRVKLIELQKKFHSLSSNQIEIVRKLHKKKLLHYFPLTLDYYTFEALKKLYLTSKINETNLILLNYLHHQKLLDDDTLILFDKSISRDAMKLLYSNNVLNEEHLAVLYSLHIEDLLEPRILHLIHNNFFRAALLILNEHDLIKLSNLLLTFSLLTNDLLKDYFHLLADKNMIKLLKRLNKENELDENAIMLVTELDEKKKSRILQNGENIVDVVNEYVREFQKEEENKNKKTKRVSLPPHGLFAKSTPASAAGVPSVTRRYTI